MTGTACQARFSEFSSYFESVCFDSTRRLLYGSN